MTSSQWGHQPQQARCSRNNTVMHETCTRLGLPPEPEKDEGLATTISFTGIDIDSVAMKLRLPEEKLGRLMAELGRWRKKKASKKRELLSLVGLLAHTCKVIQAGRSFLRRLIDMSTIAKQLDHFVRLGKEARSDIEWWWRFCKGWNGVAVLPGPAGARATETFASVASGSWGCGACWAEYWFLLQWQGAGTHCSGSTGQKGDSTQVAALGGRGDSTQLHEMPLVSSQAASHCGRMERPGDKPDAQARASVERGQSSPSKEREPPGTEQTAYHL